MSLRSYVTPLGVITGSRISSKLILPQSTSGTSRRCSTRTLCWYCNELVPLYMLMSNNNQLLCNQLQLSSHQ